MPVLAAVMLAGGCATAGFTPTTSPMPAARQALRPEYRIFYDALTDYGDWTLIEPLGFVFRPKVDFGVWRPYTDGFWAPSDSWGWVWISAEPFGWATYHYGTWLFDRFQGWVWVPGLDWGPAWVSWQMSGDYAGWAPLAPPGGGAWASNMPNGSPYVYAPLSALTSTDLRANLVAPAAAASIAATAQPIETTLERDGVRAPAGPSFARVERAIGHALQRVSLQDVMPAGSAPGAPAHGAVKPDRPPVTPGEAGPAAVDATKRAGEDAAQRVRASIGKGMPTPARVPVVKPAWIKRVETLEHAKTAPPDSTR